MQKKLNDKLHDLLCNTLRKPGVFAINNVSDLSFFLRGYEYADPDGIAIAEFFGGFSEFVSKECELPLTSWSNMISYRSFSHSHSLELFQALYEKYLELNDQKGD